jgi:predicted secreted acid phosphatase
MNKANILFHSFFFLLFSIFFYGKSFAEPMNLAAFKYHLMTYHDSGEYAKEMQEVMDVAEQYIVKKSEQHPQQQLALVLDIDETCLSNYDNLLARDFSNDLQRIHTDTLKGNATPIAACQHLYNVAKQHHVNVFFISGRYEQERQITEANLKQAGFSGWKDLILQPDSSFGKHGTVQPFKIQARKQLEAQGYTILASIGDQYSDLKGGYAQKTFKLPNPYYSTLPKPAA